MHSPLYCNIPMAPQAARKFFCRKSFRSANYLRERKN